MDIRDRLKNIADVLEELASSDYQDRIWVKGLGPEVSSYEEAVCRLFDDLMFEELLDFSRNNIVWSVSEANIMKEFISELLMFSRKFTNPPAPLEIVNNPAWARIREMAATVKEIIRSHLGRVA